MLFNSIIFAIFLPIVFIIYWLLRKNLRLQNLFVVVASYVFYGWWDWRFLLLIAFTSFCSWLSGILIERNKTQINTADAAINIDKQDINKKEESSVLDNDSTVTAPQSACMQASRQPDDPFRSTNIVTQSLSDDSFRKNVDCINCEKSEKNIFSAKFWLWLNIAINIGILAIFKYYDFFVSEFGAMLGINTNNLLLRVILPVGISFYTFQALSYSIDVYRGRIAPTKDPIAFFAYVAFFPQLVAGPIERATNLLPQFEKARTFDYAAAVDGMRRILWGLFKKVVVADNCATYVDQVWNQMADGAHPSGSTLVMAAILFTFQIYGDFSGYSDIAIGTAKLFGINLKDNFLMPYFSRSVAEFWKRWHISLNTWFVDYVYIPLGGSRNGQWKTIRNTFVIFLLSGLWHGANWTYVTWGFYHALLFVPLILMGATKKYRDTATWRQIPQMLLTFGLVVIGWIIFRAPSIAEAGQFITAICDKSLLSAPWLVNRAFYLPTLISIAVMLHVEWLNREQKHGLARISQHVSVRYAVYFVLTMVCMLYMYLHIETDSQFIYFQF